MAHNGSRVHRRVSATRRLVWIGATVVMLGVVIVLSLALGSRTIPFTEAMTLLWQPDQSIDSTVLHELRIPRTLLVVTVGLGLGIAGALMQSLTRNPLADPGILGVNAGAGLAVVLFVALTGVVGIWYYLWFAFLGAAVASVGVYLLATSGRSFASPVRLALAGVAVSAALTALTQTVILSNQVAFNEFRFWVSGSAEGRLYPVLLAIAPFILLGILLAFLIGPALNAIALGDETAKSLGVRVQRTRVVAMIAITVLCGAATAAVGPISFVGLAVPFLARFLVGSDLRWVLVISLTLGPIWMMSADVIARLVVAPQEVPAGIVAALLGAPVFIAIVRRAKVAAL